MITVLTTITQKLHIYTELQTSKQILKLYGNILFSFEQILTSKTFQNEKMLPLSLSNLLGLGVECLPLMLAAGVRSPVVVTY